MNQRGEGLQIDLGRLDHPRYDKHAMLTMLGRAGLIALEVHDNDPRMGDKRWGYGAKVRWRNLRIREITDGADCVDATHTRGE